MAGCVVCETVVSRNQSKITCTVCSGICHASCVNMSKADIEYIINENKPWRCQRCSEGRRQSMAYPTQVQDENTDLSQIIKMLQEAKMKEVEWKEIWVIPWISAIVKLMTIKKLWKNKTKNLKTV